jgi:hypothetical protein
VDVHADGHLPGAAGKDDPGQQGEDHGQREIEVGIASRQGRHCSAHQGAGGRVRSDHELARGTKKRIGHQGQYAGIESDHRRESGKLGVGYAHRQGHCRHRETGDQVMG